MANPYGFTIGLQGGASSSLNSQAITDMVALGAQCLRFQIWWSAIDATGTTNQNAGTYTWAAYDSAVTKCNAAGIDIILTILKAPAQFQSGSNPEVPSYTATFASQIASRYNGGAHGTVNGIEVGNEDYNLGADTTSAPWAIVQQLALTMKAVYPAIKAVSSSISVGVAAKLNRNSDGYKAWFDTLLNPATGPYISSVFQGDYINFHYYTGIPSSPLSLDPTVSNPSANGGHGIPSIADAIAFIDAKRTQYSQTVPVYCTETGFPVNSNNHPAAQVTSQAVAWQYQQAVLDACRTSQVVSRVYMFTLGYYDGYGTGTSARDGDSIVQGKVGAPILTTTFTKLRDFYIPTYPTWTTATGPTFNSSPPSLSFNSSSSTGVPGVLPGQFTLNGVSNFLYGTQQTVDFGNPNTVINTPAIQAQVKSAGLTIMRLPSSSGVTTYSDATLDARIAACVACGCVPLVIIGHDAGQTFANHVVSYLGNRCLLYEFYNEPDLNPGIPNTAAYLALWNAWIPTLRGLNPAAAFGGPALGVVASFSSYLQPWLAGCVTSNIIPDFVSFHDYPCGSQPSASVCATKAQNFANDVNALRTIIVSTMGATAGNAMPICITEWNIDYHDPPASYANASNSANESYIDTWYTTALQSMANAGVAIACQFDCAGGAESGQADLISITSPFPAQAGYSGIAAKATAFGGTVTPPPQTVILTNTASTSVNYTATDSATWLAVTPSSGSIAAGKTASASISVNITGLAAGTYTGSVTWTAGALTTTVSVVLVVGTGGAPPPPPPPPALTPLTAYFSNVPSTITTTANKVYTLGGNPANVNTATTLGTATGWGELVVQGSASPWAAAGAIGGPAGYGFLWGAVTLEGNDLQPGTFTGAVRLNMIGAGAVSITADIHLRLWRWNALTGYNSMITDCSLSAQTILTTKTVFAPTNTTSVVTSFGVGDKLYLDLKVNVLTNTGPSTAQISLNDLSTDIVTFTGMPTANVLTPGYSPTATGGGGGGGGSVFTYIPRVFGGTLGLTLTAPPPPPPPPPPVVPTTITIGTVPVPMVVGSLQAKSKVGRRGEFSVVVYDTAGASHYQQYQQMALFDSASTTVFTGYITSPVETKPGFGPLLLTSFTATDQHYLADKRIIANLYRNKTTGFIAQDIVTNILAAEGVTVGEIDAGLTMPIANFGYCTVATALDALVAAASSNGIPYYWMIDQNQVFWFVPYTAITGPTTDATIIDDGRLSGVTPSITRANPKYRNTQYVVGGFQETGPWDETRQGDGQTRAFTYSYPLNVAPTTFTLNGSAKSIAIAGTVGAQYYWTPGSPVISQDPTQTILVSTDRLHMIYQGQVSAVFSNQHVDQVAYMQGLDGSTGIVEAVITDTTVNSFAQGQSEVGQALTRYCTQGSLFTFATLNTKYQPGQLITVNYAPFGFSGTQMLVDEVDFSDQQDGFNLWRTITAVMGPYDTNWTDFFGNIINPGLGIAQSINIGVAIAVPLFPNTTLFPSDTLYPS